MRKIVPSVACLAFLGACTLPDLPPREAGAIADQQANLATDPAQAALWREAVASGAAAGIEKATIKGPVVEARKIARVSSRSAARAKGPFPETVRTALIVDAPADLEGAFSGRARVRSVQAEFVELMLDDQRIVRLQAKLDGAPLKAFPGEAADVLLRVGDLYERNDVLAVKLSEDEVIHVLVGADQPVRFALKERGLVAEQTGEPDGNTMPVRVSLGGETHILRAGEKADFGEAGMTLEVLASVAVRGPAANALEGTPFRIELVAWRSRPK